MNQIIIVVLTSHVTVFFCLTGIILEILSCNFAFVASIGIINHHKFKNVSLKDKKNPLFNLLIKFMDLGPICHV